MQKIDTGKLREILSNEGMVLDAGSTPNRTHFVSGTALAAGNSSENVDRRLPVASAIPLKVSAIGSTPTTADAQLVSDVRFLAAKKIVDEPDYWLANATKGGSCDGARVSTMLHNMARHFEPETIATDGLQVLIKRKVFRSATYWKEKATAGGKCGGDNVRTVIRNFVQTAEQSRP